MRLPSLVEIVIVGLIVAMWISLNGKINDAYSEASSAADHAAYALDKCERK